MKGSMSRKMVKLMLLCRHLLVRELDALPDLFPRRIVGFEDQAAVEADPARWVNRSPKVMVPTPGPLTQSGGRKGQIRLPVLRWCRASDFKTASS